MKSTKHKYGWKRQLPDHRDKVYSIGKPITVPNKVDLRENCPPVYDQGATGSCTGNAIAAAIEYEQIKEKDPSSFVPSRLFIYYNERDMEGTTKSDSGAAIRDGIKSVNITGACKETTWPYDESKVFRKPVAAAYKEASKYKTLSYSAVNQTENDVCGALANGDLVVLGITVFESFESEEVASSGIIPMPSVNESCVGGHAVCLAGYDKTKKVFYLRNSWGEGWGQKGYCEIPFEYVLNPQLAADFWVIKQVEI